MSVLIKGMKMPEKCGSCDLFHVESPMHCTVVKGHKTVGAPYGMPRPDWCPLVEIPEPQWIPCSERMPEEHEWIGTKKFGTTISDEVYVTFENEKGERFCRHMTFQNGELSRYDQFHMNTWHDGSKPIAWMPLPKPFEGGTE